MQYQGLTLDRFQEEAVAAIDAGKSVIVSAPTGCGKTVIAEYAVEVSRNLGKKVVYTAPIKALSNQKYRDFRARFGDASVGIQTGDVTVNPEAPLRIMTTEIFRNIILEEGRRLAEIYYVVFDEVHYIDDEERGTVWEESIILAPPSIRFVCLSATVPNIDELANWMSAVRAEEFVVVKEAVRPVPLRHHLFSAKYGIVGIKDLQRLYRKKPSERKKFLRGKPSPREIVQHVLRQKKFPVLYFCFNRRACERNAEMHARLNLLDNSEKERVTEMIKELVAQYRLEGYERLGFMRGLWERGCAYHHAGILPAAKEIVERLFTAGLIKLLFCTETFALGVNMPASSVIFDELERFNGVEFEYLATRAYQQMAGRAGRRGMDKEGNVYSLIVPEGTDPRQVERILSGESEVVRSRFYASYSTILSLYSRFGDGAYDIFRKSLRNYYHGSFGYTKSYQKEEEQIRKRIQFLQSTGFLKGTDLTPKGKLAASVPGYEIQAAELYYSRSFDDCTPQQLCVVLAAIVTEERKRNLQASDMSFSFTGANVIRKLRNVEIKHGVDDPVRELDFALAAPTIAWANGCTLAELESYGVPEGDLVRLFRMVIQVLRVLRERLEDPVIAEKMQAALRLMNRDVVDAQAELEVR